MEDQSKLKFKHFLVGINQNNNPDLSSKNWFYLRNISNTKLLKFSSKKKYSFFFVHGREVYKKTLPLNSLVSIELIQLRAESFVLIHQFSGASGTIWKSWILTAPVVISSYCLQIAAGGTSSFSPGHQSRTLKLFFGVT